MYKSKHFSPGDKVFVRDATGTLHIAEVKNQLRNTVWLKLHGREYGVQSHQLHPVPTVSNPRGRHLSCGDLSLKDCVKLQKIYEALREERGYSKGRSASIAWKTVTQKKENAPHTLVAMGRMGSRLMVPRNYRDRLESKNGQEAIETMQGHHHGRVDAAWTSPVVNSHRVVLLRDKQSRAWHVYWISFQNDLVTWEHAGSVSRTEARAIGIELFMRAGTSPNKAMAVMSKFPEDAREESSSTQAVPARIYRNTGMKERASRALGRKYSLLSDASPVIATSYFQSIHEAQHKRHPTQGWVSPTVSRHRIVLLSEAANRWYIYWVTFDAKGHPVGWTSDGPVSRVEARAIGIELFMKSGVSPNKALAIMTRFPEDAREERPRGHLRLVKNAHQGKQHNPDVDKVVARGQRYIAALENYAEAVRDGRNTTAARKKMEKAKSEFRDSLGAGIPLTIVAAAIGATVGSLTFGTIGALIGSVVGGFTPSLIEAVPDKGEEFDEDASHGSFRPSMATTPRLSRLT